jgi:hypothetical protein
MATRFGRAIGLLIIALAPAPVAAADLSNLYSDAVLAERLSRYEEHIRWNFDNVVLGSLTPAERQALGPVRLDIPLRGAGDMRGHPLAFYAGGGVVTVPVQSVKFFDDLTLAWAYFWANGLSLEPVTDYVAMVKYRDPAEFGGRFPPPLEALGVPADSWKTDPKVDDVSQKALKSALVWIMGHELGHVYHGHQGYAGVSAEAAQAHEVEADRFANTIMRRIGVPPLGMSQFFMVMAHFEPNRADFASEAAWTDYYRSESTHPMTAERMTALADDLMRAPEEFASSEADVAAGVALVEFAATQIRGIGDILADPEIQRSIAAKALATDLTSLRRWQAAAGAPAGAVAAFDGSYAGSYRHHIGGGETESLDAIMELQRQGNTVVGRFWFGLGEGTINGVVREDRMTYEWVWGNAFGRGVLEHDPDSGRVTGAWGYDQSLDNGGFWDVAPQ